MTAPLAEKNTRTALVLALQRLNIYSDDEQRHVVARWTKGRARRRTELTEDEARSLIGMLRTMTEEEVQRVLAAPLPPAPVVEPAREQLAEVLAPLIEPQPAPVAVPDVEPPAPEPPAEVEPVAQVPDDPVPAEVLEPVVSTPEELQAAAEAAVARYRKRMADGHVWVAPPPPPVPPRRRVALDVPMPDYSKIEGTRAYAEAHGKSWASREGGTWIDRM